MRLEPALGCTELGGSGKSRLYLEDIWRGKESTAILCRPTIALNVKCYLGLILRASFSGFHCYFHSGRLLESPLDGDNSCPAQCAASISVPS